MSTLAPKTRNKRTIVSPRPNSHRKLSRPRQITNIEALLSVDDWLALPDTKPRYELIGGKLVQKMTTTNEHTWAASRFLIHCSLWGDVHGWKFMSEGTGVRIDEHNGAVPDVVGFSPDQRLLRAATYNPAPFLVAEVLSKSTAKYDRTHKLRGYAAIGVQLYILIDPLNQTLEIFRLDAAIRKYGGPEVLGAKDIWQPEELPGLRLELKDLWFN